MDFRRSIVAVAVILLTMMLLGGFYVQNLVFWIQWAEYLSFFAYTPMMLLSTFSSLQIPTSGMYTCTACCENFSQKYII